MLISLRRWSLALGCFLSWNASASNPLIIDHDGGVDDLIATALHVLAHPQDIKAITITPADSFAEPATQWTVNLWKLLQPDMTMPAIGVGKNEGTNLFPHIWREDSTKLTKLHIWGEIKASAQCPQQPFPDALTVLKEALQNSDESVTILATGPLTNIAELVHAAPELVKKIRRIYVMGGAFSVQGNVEESGHDGSAEWNIYNEPLALQHVLESGIPMTLIPLDATQHAQISLHFLQKLHGETSQAARLVFQSLQVITPLILNGQYMFWDTLTSATILQPDLVRSQEMNVKVLSEGPSMGKTLEDDQGQIATVGVWSDRIRLENLLLKILH